MADIIQLTSSPVRVPAAVGGINGEVLSDPKDMIDVSAYDSVDLEVTVFSGANINVGTLTLYSTMTVPKNVDEGLAATTAANLTGSTTVLVQGPTSSKALLRYLGWKLENSSGSDFAVSISGVARRG